MEESQAIDFLSTLVPFTMVVFIIAIGVILLNQQFRKNLLKQRLEKDALKNKYQQDIIQTSIQVQEDERKRIAQDLHDELGAALSISRMQLVQLEEKAKNEATTFESGLNNVRKTLENALKATRRISHELMPVQLAELGWIKATQVLLEKAEEAGKLSVDFETNGAIESLEWPAKVALYRVCAELVNNTLRHAQATHIKLKVAMNKSHLSCYYQDNGQGVDLDTARKGVGLRSLEGRTLALAGKITFDSAPAKGFSMELEIPVTQRSND